MNKYDGFLIKHNKVFLSQGPTTNNANDTNKNKKIEILTIYPITYLMASIVIARCTNESF